MKFLPTRAPVPGAEFFKGAVVKVIEPEPNGNSWHVELGKADGTVRRRLQHRMDDLLALCQLTPLGRT